uniref:Uncharacterized protein n=1 Tax=Anopheles farauti TaxID=69004 RepID=A0A182QNI3_9DIPT
MEAKFGVYVKFNGYTIVFVVGYVLLMNAYQWFVHWESDTEYHTLLEGSSFRQHPVVDGIFMLAWIIATVSLYQALQLEVQKLLYPIGFVFGVETLQVVVRDVICRIDDDAEECFLRNSQDVIVWIGKACGLHGPNPLLLLHLTMPFSSPALLTHVYYTLYILAKLFRLP